MRSRLEQHRNHPQCKTCHSVMDPLGLALENYNAVGQWRDIDRDVGLPIDASGNLTDGTPVHSPADLWRALTKDPSRFASTFTKKLMTFALGRGLEYYDMPTVRAIVRESGKQDYTLSSIVLGIVDSDAFRKDKVLTSDAGSDNDDNSVASANP